LQYDPRMSSWGIADSGARRGVNPVIVEGQVLRALSCVGLVLVCLGQVSCGSVGPKKPAGDRPRPSLDLNQPGLPGQPPPLGGGMPASAANSGILAGQVLDSYNRRPPPTVIQITAIQQANEPKAAPLEVAADPQGYFVIQSLQQGRHYQLIARARDGDQVLAGTVWATPPNPRLVIRVREEHPASTTPPVTAAGPPGHPPGWPGAARGDGAWSPGRTTPSGPAPERPAGLGAPVGSDEPSPRVPVDPSRIGADPAVRRNGIPADIPNGFAPGAGSGAEPAVPFCSLTGRQLTNFALYDLNGLPWVWRQRNNRLTLIDFWGTWCPSCLHGMPHLKILQDRYGPYGLEVVGIAYENGVPAAQVEQVRRVAQRLQINYTLLMGGDRLSCPVRSQFRVAMWPTLFLIDQEGRIIWQESGLDRAKLSELERTIRQKLGMRN
jgi:thiol-disulfide isomerase/thioredoxin